MRRWIALLALGAAVLPGVGCMGLGMGGGKYVDKRPDGGTVAFQDGQRDAAMAMIARDYGDVKVDDEYEAAKRTAAETGRNPLTARGDDGTWHVRFSKKTPGEAPLTAAPPVGARQPAPVVPVAADTAAAPAGWDTRPAAGTHGDDCPDCRK